MNEEYIIVIGVSAANFSADVTTKLSEGYKLHGPMVMNGNAFYQAMVREKVKPSKKSKSE